MKEFVCEPITKARLTFFKNACENYYSLLIKKNYLVKKNSSQPNKSNRLEEINQDIRKYEAQILPERDIIINQINRLDDKYRKILILRYIKGWKWSAIIENFFDFEDDFEDEKNFKYKDKMMYWHRQAWTQLEEISSRPYLPQIKQLTIGE